MPYRCSAGRVATTTPAESLQDGRPRKGVTLRKRLCVDRFPNPTNQLPLLKSGSCAGGRGVRYDVQVRILRGGVPKNSTIGGVRHPHRWAAHNRLFMALNCCFRTLL